MIYVENLSITIGSHCLLATQTRAILRGQFVGLLGSNGSGKSTFLKTVAGIIPPTEGNIFFNRRLLGLYNARELAQLRGFIPADPVCFWSLKVKDIVKGSPMNIWVQPLDLEPLWERPFPVLSSGEKARVMLGAQFVRNVEVLILDEILSHLDDTYQRRVMGLLHKFAAAQGTILLALHEPDLAHIYCHQVWEISHKVLHLQKVQPPLLKDVQSL